jgi:hypothetical protein
VCVVRHFILGVSHWPEAVTLLFHLDGFLLPQMCWKPLKTIVSTTNNTGSSLLYTRPAKNIFCVLDWMHQQMPEHSHCGSTQVHFEWSSNVSARALTVAVFHQLAVSRFGGTLSAHVQNLCNNRMPADQAA